MISRTLLSLLSPVPAHRLSRQSVKRAAAIALSAIIVIPLLATILGLAIVWLFPWLSGGPVLRTEHHGAVTVYVYARNILGKGAFVGLQFGLFCDVLIVAVSVLVGARVVLSRAATRVGGPPAVENWLVARLDRHVRAYSLSQLNNRGDRCVIGAYVFALVLLVIGLPTCAALHRPLLGLVLGSVGFLGMTLLSVLMWKWWPSVPNTEQEVDLLKDAITALNEMGESGHMALQRVRDHHQQCVRSGFELGDFRMALESICVIARDGVTGRSEETQRSSATQQANGTRDDTDPPHHHV